MNIKAIVTGEQDIKKLGDSIENMGTQAEATSVKTVALGNVGATAIEALGKALVVAVQAGAEFNNSIEEVNGTLTTTNELQDRSTNAFGALSGAILEGTGVWDGYRNSLEVLTVVMETVTEALGGMTAKQLEHEQIMKRIAIERKARLEKEQEEQEKFDEWVKDKLEKEEARAKKKEDAEIARGKRALSRYNQQLKNKEDAHQKEIAITLELINIYEEQGRSTDELIDKLEKLEAKRVNHTKTIREEAEEIANNTKEVKDNTEATKDSTEATHADTEATNRNTSSTVANTRASEANTQVNGQNYSRNEMDNRNDPNGAYQRNRSSIQLEDIARNTRQTNQYLRGD